MDPVDVYDKQNVSLTQILKHLALALLTLTVYEILLFKGRSILSPSQWEIGSKRFSVTM